MAQPIPRHPAVVLRPHGLRTIIAVAAVVLAIAAAVVVAIVVADDDPAAATRSSSPVPERVTDSISSQTELRRAAVGGKAQPVGTRFDGGPDEGTRGVGR
jgi:hypothetical protein